MIFHGIQATKTCRNPGLLRALGRLWQGICGQGETWNLQGPDGPEFCFHMAFSKSRAIERYQWINTEPLHNYGTSRFSITSTISTGLFSIAMLVYQRVNNDDHCI